MFLSASSESPNILIIIIPVLNCTLSCLPTPYNCIIYMYSIQISDCRRIRSAPYRVRAATSWVLLICRLKCHSFRSHWLHWFLAISCHSSGWMQHAWRGKPCVWGFCAKVPWDFSYPVSLQQISCHLAELGRVSVRGDLFVKEWLWRLTHGDSLPFFSCLLNVQ